MSRSSGRSQRDELINSHCRYVSYVVGKLVRSMALSSDCFDELVAAGNLGLIEAAERFDPAQQRDFKSFAFLRIRGAVIDALREFSGLSSKATRYLKALQAVQELRERMHSDREFDLTLVHSADRQLELVLEYASQGAIAYRLSMTDVEEEAVAACGQDETNEDKLLLREEHARLRGYVAELPEKERAVIEKYYFKDRSFAEILREDANMSKSWISKLHARGIKMLREMYEATQP